MKIKYNKAYTAIRLQEKLPRKVKKHIIGKKIIKKKLKNKLRQIVESEKDATQMLIDGEIDNLFCPICGCEESYIVNHYCEYPEVYLEAFCARCGNKVEMQDNSPCYHVLDIKGFSFD